MAAFEAASAVFRKLCAKKPHERTREEINGLLDSIPPMVFYLQLPRPMREELCLSMALQDYNELDTVITEGEVGDRFYVVLDGTVAVFKSIAKAIDNLAVVVEVWAHQRGGIAIDEDTATPRPSTTCRYYY